MENQKILVKEYLETIYNNLTHTEKKIYKKLTCKEIAKRISVTPATISNLTTASSFKLIHDIAYEIYTYYEKHFESETDKLQKEIKEAEERNYSEFYMKDIFYIIQSLTIIYVEY